MNPWNTPFTRTEDGDSRDQDDDRAFPPHICSGCDSRDGSDSTGA